MQFSQKRNRPVSCFTIGKQNADTLTAVANKYQITKSRLLDLILQQFFNSDSKINLEL